MHLSRFSEDPDGDGNDNDLEFLVGLNPKNPSSRFAVRLEAVEGHPTHRKILFTAVPSIFGTPRPAVAIQYRTSLTEGDWQPLIQAFINQASPEWWAIDTDAGGPTKFYRVQFTDP